ncbi:hypothetical protein [Lysinibacillus sp. SGAir0095]|uniref:hypothetical protein n=1 Tax=Lysinibacillus sp. SGAir0095 TaxID=2070463 RepID=UPI00143D6C95|nr:hypothetical protein [Lysinibacillus sp. SGAir0095]
MTKRIIIISGVAGQEQQMLVYEGISEGYNYNTFGTRWGLFVNQRKATKELRKFY